MCKGGLSDTDFRSARATRRNLPEGVSIRASNSQNDTVSLHVETDFRWTGKVVSTWNNRRY